MLKQKQLYEELDWLLLETDDSGKVVNASRAFFNTFHIKEQEVIGKPIRKLTNRYTDLSIEEIGYSKIFNLPCLIKKLLISNKTFYYILLTNQDIKKSELISFMQSMESKKYKKKSTRPNRYHFDDIIGDSPAMRRVKDLAAKISIGNSTILLTGESGTGKELFAQAIHGLSSRQDHPFIAVNCVAIPDDLFESELFGYEAGAFSGAKQDGKPGKIELAQNGTLFLDEISELSYQSQGKLLRVLQEREVERLGATKTKQVDIRIIAATNRDLKAMVEKKQFREDLFYRLYVFDLQIPPLRIRREDILPLTYHFIEVYNQKFDKEVHYIDARLEEWLLNYEWPGNVRELKASIERGMNIVEDDTLTLDDLSFSQVNMLSPTILKSRQAKFSTLDEAVRNAEITAIQQALKDADGDRTLAAQKLNIHLSSLYRKISKYNLS